MAILETAILYQTISLLEVQYYSTEEVLDRTIRNSLLQAITSLASEAFGEEMQSFSLGAYSIVLISHEISLDLEDDEAASAGSTERIMMYCIVNKNTDEKITIASMHEVLFQFTNRYSLNDLNKKKTKKFERFKKRIEKIFGDLILKSEDRFKSLF